MWVRVAWQIRGELKCGSNPNRVIMSASEQSIDCTWVLYEMLYDEPFLYFTMSCEL